MFLVEKMRVLLLVTELYAIYGTEKYVVMSARVCALSQLNPHHTLSPRFLTILTCITIECTSSDSALYDTFCICIARPPMT
jgi:hypothetical protein